MLRIHTTCVKSNYHIICKGIKLVKRISATKAARDFSEVINTIKFKDVHYIIERGGKPVASLKSIEEKPDIMTLGELKNLLKKLPRLENELDAFASDLEEIIRNQPLMTTEDLWG